MNSSTLRRLAADHAALHKAELPPYYLHTPDSSSTPDDLTQLTILLAGPQGTSYANGVWKLHLKIPIDYPKSPPKAIFKTKIYHPNVEEATGSVCLDTLKRDWQPKLTLRDILITISCLLINPNPDSALNSEAGKLLQEDFDSFARKARLMTSIHARIPTALRKAVAEAKTRGEDKKPTTIKILPINTSDSDCEDEDDEASASKENDPSISPTAVSPFPPPTGIHIPRRNTILGKRPLADLPTPEEPPTDDEDNGELQHPHLSASERNIVANTPNLSQGMSSLSFTNIPPTSPLSSDPESACSQPDSGNTASTQSNRRIANPSPRRKTHTNPSSSSSYSHSPTTSSSSSSTSFTFTTGLPTPVSSTFPIFTNTSPALQEPRQKRHRSSSDSDGKENLHGGQRVDAENKTRGGMQEHTKTGVVGLGVRNAQRNNEKSSGGMGVGARAKANMRPRVGLRRL